MQVMMFTRRALAVAVIVITLSAASCFKNAISTARNDPGCSDPAGRSLASSQEPQKPGMECRSIDRMQR